jgi:large subunit ribosomal protein L22
MEAIAKTRHLKGSPRKARLVIDLIRGRNVSQALNILKFTDKRAADPIEKTLRSAIANATYLAEQQNIAIDPDDLWVKTCFIDMGAHKNRRRMRPAPQGRAYREQRHYCHITILVSSDEQPVKESKKPETPVVEKAPKAPAKAAAKKDAPKEEKKAKTAAPVEEVETPVEATETVAAPVAEVVETAAPEVEATETVTADEAQSEKELEKE